MKKISQIKNKNIFNKIKKYLFISLIIIIFIYNISYQLFKFEMFFIAQTDIMKNDIKKYDVLFLKKPDYKLNDIVVFKLNSQDRIGKIINNTDETYTIKANLNLYYYENINSSEIVGKVYNKISHVGIIFLILRSNIVTLIFLMFFIIKLIKNEKQIKNSIIRRNKREDIKNK